MHRIIIKTLLLILLVSSRSHAFVRSIGGLDSEGKPIFVSWAIESIPITYVINEKTSTSLPNITKDSNPIEAIVSAFNSWDSILTSFISFKFGGKTPISNAAADGVNLITFVDPSFSDPAALAITITTFVLRAGLIRLPDGRILEASFPGQILDADIIFDTTDIFSTMALPDTIDLESVAAHEIGHFLGLDHTTILSATMLPFTPTGTISQRTLDMDDTVGASSIYPEDVFLSSTGSIQGKIKSSRDGSGVFGAGVVAIDSFGRPTVSTVTSPDGSYTLLGLAPGNYFLVIEPLDDPVTAKDFLDFFDILSKVSSPSPSFPTQFFGSPLDGIQVEPHSTTVSIDITVNSDLPPPINITHLGIIKREERRVSISSSRFMGVDPGGKIGLAILGSGIGPNTSISFSGSGITSSVDLSTTSSFTRFFSSFGGGVALNVDISPGAIAGPRNIVASNGSASSVLVGGLEIRISTATTTTIPQTTTTTFPETTTSSTTSTTTPTTFTTTTTIPKTPAVDLDSPKTNLTAGDSFILDLTLKSNDSKDNIDLFFSVEVGGPIPITLFLGPKLQFVLEPIPVVSKRIPIDASVRVFGPAPTIFVPTIFGKLIIPPNVRGSFTFVAEIVNSKTKASISSDRITVNVR